MTHYERWRDVPDHLMTANQIGELEFPRAVGTPAATVNGSDYRGKPTVIDLYNAAAAAPTRTTAARLAELEQRTLKVRRCIRCGSHSQRLLDPTEPLCWACRHIDKVLRAQQDLANHRDWAIGKVTDLLAADRAAIVQTSLTTPPRTPSGRARPSTAARVWAVDAATGTPLVDVVVRLVSPRAHHIPAGACDPETARPLIHAQLADRPLIAWSTDELRDLSIAAPHPDRRGWSRSGDAVQTHSMFWHGTVDPIHPDRVVGIIPPGTPDRLLLHLRRIAATPLSTGAGT